jgi:hypothetical protein
MMGPPAPVLSCRNFRFDLNLISPKDLQPQAFSAVLVYTARLCASTVRTTPTAFKPYLSELFVHLIKLGKVRWAAKRGVKLRAAPPPPSNST